MDLFSSSISKIFIGSLLYALCFVLLVIPLASIPELGSSSEAREGHIARLMFSGSDLLLPLRDGRIPSKPPLYHWISAGIASAVGFFSIHITRFVSVISAAATLVALMGFCSLIRREDCPRGKDDWWVATAAVCILSTCYGFLRLCIDSRVDLLFSLFVMLAYFSSLIAQRREREGDASHLEWAWSVAFWGSAALSVLTKGPLGLVLSVLLGFTAGVQLLGWTGALRYWIRPRLGWLLFLIVVLPWYLSAYLQEAEGFLQKQILFENFARFFGGEHITARPWWYYLPAFLRTTFPWGVLFVFLLVAPLFGVTSIGIPTRNTQSSESSTLFAMWVVVGIFFLSLATGKRASYLIPLLPALAAHLSFRLGDWVRDLSEDGARRFRRIGDRLLEGLLCLCLVCFLLSDLVSELQVTHKPGLILAYNWLTPFLSFYQIVLAVPFVALTLMFCIDYCRERSPWKLWLPSLTVARVHVCWLAVLTVMMVFLSGGLGVKASLKGYAQQGESLNRAIGEHSRLYVVRQDKDESFDVLLFYFGREVENVSPHSEFLHCGQPILAHADWYGRIRRARDDVRFAELLRLHSPLDAARDKHDGEFVVFTCQRGGELDLV